jgi:hypothetical protein
MGRLWPRHGGLLLNLAYSVLDFPPIPAVEVIVVKKAKQPLLSKIARDLCSGHEISTSYGAEMADCGLRFSFWVERCCTDGWSVNAVRVVGM